MTENKCRMSPRSEQLMRYPWNQTALDRFPEQYGATACNRHYKKSYKHARNVEHLPRIPDEVAKSLLCGNEFGRDYKNECLTETKFEPRYDRGQRRRHHDTRPPCPGWNAEGTGDIEMQRIAI